MSALICPTDLVAARADDGPKVLDVQFELGGRASDQLYAAGHLPGAAHLRLEWELAGTPGSGGRHPLPDPGVLQEALRRCGIGDGDGVVVYDQQSSLAAGRAWWVLRWAGVSDVRVLDGGLAAWLRAGLPTSTEDVAPGAGSVSVHPGSVPFLGSADAATLAAQGALFDVRAPERFRGEVEPIDPVPGHIPGATNLPMALMQHPDGTFRNADEIREIAAAAGVDPGRPIGTSCGSGVTAAQMVLALAQAGIESMPYIGSWSQWIADPARPVATGD